MNKIKYFLIGGIAVLFAAGCLEEQALEIQKPYTYDEQYFQNIRDFKKSEHTLSYVYYAAWAPLEGSEGYKDPASYGERLIGLPDSLDIVNLWMGYPSPNPESENYSPIAYADMKYMQETLGTRFVLHGDAASTRELTYNGTVYKLHETYEALQAAQDEETKASLQAQLNAGLEAHGQLMIDKVVEAGLDGIDVDYEPTIPIWEDKANLTYLMKYIDERLNNIDPDLLVIVDAFNKHPEAATEQYVDYYIVQSYSGQNGWQIDGVWHTYSDQLNRTYKRYVEPWGCPMSKFIVCETAGQADFHLTGGAPCVNYPTGEPIYTNDGSQMYSFEFFARWAKDNDAAGWGVFYVDRNYYSASKTPYREFRRAIQIVNPSIN